ncbi:hypothetical protein, partial [Rhodovulum sulfidophilum]|uniref:hypothetical protein n=1 Tax=Rhodovulum sulfidophilum TaxID=35806 RepID=UPI001C4C7CC5
FVTSRFCIQNIPFRQDERQQAWPEAHPPKSDDRPGAKAAMPMSGDGTAIRRRPAETAAGSNRAATHLDPPRRAGDLVRS